MTANPRFFWKILVLQIRPSVFAFLVGLLAVAPPAGRADDIVPIRFAELISLDAAAATRRASADVLTIPGPLPGEIVTDPPPGEPRTIIADGAIIEPGTTEILENAPGGPVISTSSRAVAGLRLDDYTLDEMPEQASSGDWFSNGNWYGSAEMIWFDRSRNYRRLLGYDATLPIPPEKRIPVGSFTTTAQPFNLAPGARITLGEYLGRDYLDRDQSLEMTYYGGLAFYQEDAFNALPNSVLVVPPAGGVPGFTGAQKLATAHNSIFNSMEWNFKLHRRLGRDQLVMSPNGNWSRHAERAWLPALIIGTRVTNVNETFTFTSRRTGVDRSLFGGDYLIDSQNWLWGMNIGGELISQNEFYFWGLRGRATPSMSFTANQQTLSGVNNNVVPAPAVGGSLNRSTSAQQFGPGFVGDLSLFAGWNVTPNFSLKAGYDFLWVAGIATATRQLDLNNVRGNPHDAGGQIFYNGLSFGCEGSW